MSRWVVTAMHSVLGVSVGISKGFTLSIGFGLTIALRHKVWDSLHPEKRLTVISQGHCGPCKSFPPLSNGDVYLGGMTGHNFSCHPGADIICIS